MSLQPPNGPHDEMEARITAWLLGELSAEEEGALREAMAKDAALAQLHDRLARTIGLVREAAASLDQPATAPAAPLQLSPGRREKLLASIQSKKPKKPSRLRLLKAVRADLWRMAAMIMVLGLLAAVLLFNQISSEKWPQRLALGSLRGMSTDAEDASRVLKEGNLEPGVFSAGQRPQPMDEFLAERVGAAAPANAERGPTPLFRNRLLQKEPQAIAEDGRQLRRWNGASSELKALGDQPSKSSSKSEQDAKKAETFAGGKPAQIALPQLSEFESRDGFAKTAQPSANDFFDHSDQPASDPALAAPERRISLGENLALHVDGGAAARLGDHPAGLGGTAGGVLVEKALPEARGPVTAGKPAAPIADDDGTSPRPEGTKNRSGAVDALKTQVESLARAKSPRPTTQPLALEPASALPADRQGDSAAPTPAAVVTPPPPAAQPLRPTSPAPPPATLPPSPRVVGFITITNATVLNYSANGWAAPPETFEFRGKSNSGAETAALAGTLAKLEVVVRQDFDGDDTMRDLNGVDVGGVVAEAKDRVGEMKKPATTPPGYAYGTDASSKGKERFADDKELEGLKQSLEKRRAGAQGAEYAGVGLAPRGLREGLPLPTPEIRSGEEDAAIRRPAPTAPIPQPEVSTRENAFSTFSLNVSDVSFKLAAAALEKGTMPDPATVRSEEFINAFDYHDPEPPSGVPVAFAWERARYPFAHNRDLLRFSIKTAASGRQPGRPLNLVLLLDNSGSMERADRVRIRHECLRVLAGQLQPQDRVSVVSFARTARLWIDGLAGNQASELPQRVGGLAPEGGTNLEEAMNLAYQTAVRHFLAGGMNRVVLLTDGAANLGDVQPESLKKKVETYRQQGIALDCFGIGWEGYNDDLLEVLSRNGDGRYGFVNTPEAAASEFAGQLAGALQVAASDVKVQVEFNPRRTTAYRQIGYAKHQLKKEQFRDNTVDAAEIAAAEAGNALYVVQVNPQGEGPVATVRVRFKVPGTTDYREHEWLVPFNGTAAPLEQSTTTLRLAATASAFSEWLVSSPYAAEVTPDKLLSLFGDVPQTSGADPRPKKLEEMLRQARSLAGK